MNKAQKNALKYQERNQALELRLTILAGMVSLESLSGEEGEQWHLWQ